MQNNLLDMYWMSTRGKYDGESQNDSAMNPEGGYL